MRKSKFNTIGDNIAVLTPTGRLVLGEMDGIRNDLDAAIGNGYRYILLDLANVYLIDAAALGELVHYYTKAREVGASISLANPTRLIRDILIITKLVTVFPIINDNQLFQAVA
jgi:stage II sporulation protein AA (anti-sigma F factor antagonist)